MKSCWIKQPDGTEVFDAEACRAALLELQMGVVRAGAKIILAMEGPKKGAETIHKQIDSMEQRLKEQQAND